MSFGLEVLQQYIKARMRSCSEASCSDIIMSEHSHIVKHFCAPYTHVCTCNRGVCATELVSLVCISGLVIPAGDPTPDELPSL